MRYINLRFTYLLTYLLTRSALEAFAYCTVQILLLLLLLLLLLVVTTTSVILSCSKTR